MIPDVPSFPTRGSSLGQSFVPTFVTEWVESQFDQLWFRLEEVSLSLIMAGYADVVGAIVVPLGVGARKYGFGMSRYFRFMVR